MSQSTLSKNMRKRQLVAWFAGKLVAYEGSLEVAKKLHMGGPFGNTGLLSRARSVHQDKWPYRVRFREFVAPYRPARSRRKIAYGVLRTGNRVRTAVHDPAS